MSITEKDKIFEQKRLHEVYGKLQRRIEDLEISLNDSLIRFKKSNEQMWDSGKRNLVDFYDAIENMPYLESIKADYFKLETIKKELNRMHMLQRDMYFGRIDFQEEDEKNVEKIYIGKFSLTDDEGQYLVFDWRANICSLFYENEIGHVFYDAPDGRIYGDMSKKRQFEILYDNIISMFDSSIMIDDDILKDILSKSKDSKMSNIVETIQKEQNQAIRSTYNTIIVDGPAGCGKTSIAMHRAAWLMYKFKNELQNNQIIIFSPNETFNDYVSEVLPELGEENISMSTFHNLAYKILSDKRVLISKYTELEDVLLGNEYVHMNDIWLKYSISFAKKLKDYANLISKGDYPFKDLVIEGSLIFTKQEFESMFYVEYSFNDVITRLAKIRLVLNERIFPIIRNLRIEYVKKVKSGEIDMSEGYIKLKEKCRRIQEAVDMSVAADFEMIYAQFLKHSYSSTISASFLERLNNGYIYAEDTAPLIYLRLLLGKKYNFSEIRHVIIDEFQDYSYIEKIVISMIFKKCHMTLLGDVNQKINYYIEKAPDKDIFVNARSIKLDKSYRSTYQIAKFCNDMLRDNLDIKYFNRQGNEPQIITIDSFDLDSLSSVIKDIVSKYVLAGYRSIAVITRTESFAKQLQPYLKDVKISRVTEKNTSYTYGSVLMPSYLTKGLEFDAVIVIDTLNDKFKKEEEMNLFYTCCTRALHELSIIN
ncbi:MAG TPA: AAA family ATPase [Clostridia bacterium]|nr:AAA family ATPase [Clostridia bacterium]